jgi:hypothetical protein
VLPFLGHGSTGDDESGRSGQDKKSHDRILVCFLFLKADVQHRDDYITLYKKLSPASVNFTSRTFDGLVMPEPACGKSEKLNPANIGWTGTLRHGLARRLTASVPQADLLPGVVRVAAAARRTSGRSVSGVA